MHFNKHSELIDRHAFLSPSQYHWLRYSDEKLIDRYEKNAAKERGTKLHALAAECIRMGVKLKGSGTMAVYVNDAIGYKMVVEQPLYFSEYCFGTADAIAFRKNQLRIHDLKTGETPASMEQLEIYAAIFCLEYGIKPGEIKTELRIYQSGEVIVYEPTAEDLVPIMDKIVYFDKLLHAHDEED